jgi:hypothetical protein
MIINTQLTNCLSTLMTTWTQVVAGEEKIADADNDGLYECLKEWYAQNFFFFSDPNF